VPPQVLHAAWMLSQLWLLGARANIRSIAGATGMGATIARD
jgi:hypothetical protein